MADIRRTAKAQKAAQIRREHAQARQLVESYRGVWQRIKQDLDTLGGQIKAARAAGEPVNRGWLLKQHNLASLLGQVEGEIHITTSFLERSITDAQADAVLAGRINAEELIRASLGPPPKGVTWTPKLPSGAVEHLIGYSGDGRPLGELLSKLPSSAAHEMRRTLVTGVALGKHPAVIAREARTALGGNMARALTIARTEVLRSYRESSRATYRANNDVVTGWIWNAELDANCCAVCWGMHGQVFATEDSMDTHPGCRCALVPQTASWADLGFDVPETGVDVPSGADVFASAPADVQRAVLGPQKFAAYQQGRLALPDLVAKTHSRQWGGGRRERSLADALSATA